MVHLVIHVGWIQKQHDSSIYLYGTNSKKMFANMLFSLKICVQKHGFIQGLIALWVIESFAEMIRSKTDSFRNETLRGFMWIHYVRFDFVWLELFLLLEEKLTN